MGRSTWSTPGSAHCAGCRASAGGRGWSPRCCGRALLDAGMTLTGLAEHDSVPWNALPGMMTKADGELRLTENPSRVACSFTIQAVK
jgi:hypothetical protein